MIIIKKQILHIDVNNAFLSWSAIERLKNGESLDIRTIPAVIGGDESQRSGIVLAKSMKAKEFGVVTGETIYSAKKKCPDLQVFPGNHDVYNQYSDKMYNLLLEYTYKIERFSVDECFLDMTEFLMGKTLEQKAKEISERIKLELGFTVNIGIANNKLLAKMASDFTKPDKLHTLYSDEIKNKMWPLPIEELFMLGKNTAQKLNTMGIKTIGELAQFDKTYIINKFGKMGLRIWEYANGIDNSEVKYETEKPKGIGNSTTLPYDIKGEEKIKEILISLTELVTYRLRQYNLLAGTVCVQLRTDKFKDYTHQGKLYTATANTKDIYNKAKELLKEMYKNDEYIRLIGLRVDNLTSNDVIQISIFDGGNDKKQEKVDKVVDELKRKYGYNTVTRATNLKNNKFSEKNI